MVQKRYRIGKKLTFSDNQNIPILENKIKPGSEKKEAEIANTNYLASSIINVSDSITAPTAFLANTNLYHDPKNNTTYICANNNLVFKINGGPDSISIFQDGKISAGDFFSANNINACNGNFSGNINGNNANLSGNLAAGNAHFGNLDSDNLHCDNLIVDGNMDSNNSHCNNLVVDGNLDAWNLRTTNLDTINLCAENTNICEGIYRNSLVVTNDLFVGRLIETPQITSPTNLILSVPVNHTIGVPNIRYNVSVINGCTLGPCEIKSSKIFIVTKNIQLNADATCNGIEIIIYNRSKYDIVVRDRNIVTTIFPCSVRKMVYIDIIRTWILI